MNRRDFITRTVAAAALMPRHLGAAAKKNASDRVLLGPMKVPVTRLALGTGTNGVGGSSNQTRKLGLGGLADLLHAAYDQGVTFWDSADQYGTHPHLKQALRQVPREKVAILTKTHASTESEMKADLDRFRSELGADYLDIVLLHCMTEANWPERRKGAMNVLAQAREKGIVKTHGVSCHDLGAMKTAAANPWVQVNLQRINPAGTSMDGDVTTIVAVLRQMKAAGQGVIGMKILGAGRLRSRADESLRFVLGLDCVDCFTIGSENRDEFADLARRIAEV